MVSLLKLFCIFVLILFSMASLSAQEKGRSNTPDEEICVMTFNIRVGVDRSPNSWEERRPLVREVIEMYSPEVVGTQEGRYHQIKDMAADLQDYEWIGLGRDGGSRGEFMAVFYREDRFEPVQYDHFWLSDTPEVIGSMTWGNTNRRMVTWVQFRDLETDQEFYFFNTHLDHQIQESREKSAMLIRERVEALETDLPVLLAGDFNAVAGVNKVYDILVNDENFTDTWLAAEERRSEVVKTYHGYEGPTALDERIDWILTRGPLQINGSEIVTFSRGDRYPSDHFPVVSWLRWSAN